jgi:hypothetical protein
MLAEQFVDPDHGGDRAVLADGADADGAFAAGVGEL